MSAEVVNKVDEAIKELSGQKLADTGRVIDLLLDIRISATNLAEPDPPKIAVET